LKNEINDNNNDEKLLSWKLHVKHKQSWQRDADIYQYIVENWKFVVGKRTFAADIRAKTTKWCPSTLNNSACSMSLISNMYMFSLDPFKVLITLEQY